MTADINEEGIGLRSFHIRKERAVERAVEKIRHNLGQQWQELSSKEMDILSWALGETWATMGFYAWDSIAFSKMDLATTQKIIDLGNQVIGHEKLGSTAYNEIHQVLDNLSD